MGGGGLKQNVKRETPRLVHSKGGSERKQELRSFQKERKEETKYPLTIDNDAGVNEALSKRPGYTGPTSIHRHGDHKYTADEADITEAASHAHFAEPAAICLD